MNFNQKYAGCLAYVSLQLAFFMMMLCPHYSRAAEQAGPASSTPGTSRQAVAGASRKLAVVIAINNYPNVYPPLLGAENDAKTMMEVLVKAYGFREADIHPLL